MFAQGRRILYVWLVFGAISSFSDALFAKPSVDQLLQKYASAVESLSSVRLSGVRKSYERGGALKQETWRATKEVTLVRISDRWRLISHSRGNLWYGGKFHPHALTTEHWFDNRGNFHRIGIDNVVDHQILEDQALDSTEVDAGSLVFVAYLKDESQEGRIGYAYGKMTSPIFGYLPFDCKRWLPDLMRESGATLAKDMEMIDGYPCWVIRSQGEFGAHTLWIDPDAGHLPRRIRCHKKGADKFGSEDQAVSDVAAHGDPDHRKPNSQLRECIYDVRKILIGESEGRNWIEGFESLTTFVYANKEKFFDRAEVSYDQISFQPSEEDLMPTIDIPNGTRVHVRNARAIDCEWRDSQIVKLVDKSVVRNLTDVEFGANAERSSGRRWLIVVNIVLIVAIAAVIAYRRLKPASGT